MSAGTTRTNPIAVYDLTIPCEKFTFDQVTTWMTTYCKKWCFQKEKGTETGYLHYQCRVSMITKRRYDTMIKFVVDTLSGANVSPTSGTAAKAGDEFYVTKEDTRVEGPWNDREWKTTHNIPKRLRGDPEWYPWQQSVLDIVKTDPDDRTINVIVDTCGNQGKSFLSLWMMSRSMCERIPQQKDARDIMRMVMNMPKRQCYFIDLPRGTSHKDQNSTYAAIEEIKNGYAYDDRYSFKRELFDPPHIFVFTNQLPDEHLLSRDRWKYWTISAHKELITLKEPKEVPIRLTLNILPSIL